MENQITITIDKDKDAYLYTLLKDVKEKYRKEYLTDVIDHYKTLIDPDGGLQNGYEVPEVYKEKIKNKSKAVLQKYRRNLIKAILNDTNYLDDLGLDLGMYLHPDGVFYYMDESSVLPYIVMYRQRLRVVEELLKEKKEEK